MHRSEWKETAFKYTGSVAVGIDTRSQDSTTLFKTGKEFLNRLRGKDVVLTQDGQQSQCARIALLHKPAFSRLMLFLRY
ncbi:hypothetical protein BOV97_03560 [Solemya velum gill symbiont]|nr:hypothetical protein BOV97_03560 [Solemya velum gill symbiont]OOY63373.1 hypothetical protein BOW04_02370 [Solemya velum gill symbiont]OOY64463.1 hypothetical protein BOW05_08255 [Solemya velum gill symbiont]OOY67924.1 hypothetical protein BOW06_03540 [Solemya velum gill symbiont]OOY72088.1 hypothetical protein BOW08_06955 [Solemya velum gill symbiont]